MILTIKRGTTWTVELPDEPQFFQSFNYRELLAVYPELTGDGGDKCYKIYCAEAGHVYASSLTLDQIKGAITGDTGLMGNLQKRAFYILIHDSGYGSRITPEEFRNHYCARVSMVTPPNVYVNCEDFDGQSPTT